MNRRTFVAGSAAFAGSLRGHQTNAQTTTVASSVEANADFQGMFIRHAESHVNVLAQRNIPSDQLSPDAASAFRSPSSAWNKPSPLRTP